MMKAGQMRERITFESKLETIQPSGAASVQWIPEQTLRAELVQEDAETFLSSTERTEDRKVFRTWFADWISTDMRLTHVNATYRIAKLVPVGRLGLELHCINAASEVAQ